MLMEARLLDERREGEAVGIAKGKEEALELITDMVQTIYEETGELNIKEYWKNR